MNQIIFVTGNPTKILHANTALKEFGYEVVGKKIDIIEPREEETEKIVMEKALQAFKQLNIPLMVEDSGIFIKALNDFPKTFVHFAESTIGVAGIIKLMQGETDRRAEFRQSLAFIESGMETPKVFSYVDGGYTVADKIWNNPECNSGDFDKILIPPGESKPLCMFSKEWRAERDARANQNTIHYHQLAMWLNSRKYDN